VGLPACPVADDAGVDACSTDPFLDCPLPDCTGVDELPSCTAGQWSCIAVGECEEDAGEDAGEDAAPPPPASFACGDLACTTATTYCQIDTGGAALADGGVESWYACNALPSFCGGGAALTCECGGIQWLSPACGCITDNGVMIITCAEP
jgi:hypothetical protein